VVLAIGIWHYHDPARGGESWLEVRDLVVEEEEMPLREGVRWWALALGLGLLALAAGIAAGPTRRRSAR
jgi:hypothetical protein